MSWIYRGEPFTEASEGMHSFIYEIELAGKSYIGKKIFFNTKKKWLGKKELALQTDRRLKKYRYEKKDSNWKTYCSSSKIVELIVKEGFVPKRTILEICYSAKQATYLENKYLYEMFESPKNINENISGTIFKDEVMKWKTERE